MKWNLVKNPMAWVEYLKKNPLGLLLAIIVLCAIGGFLEIASEIREKETDRIDEYILLSMRTPGDTSDPIGSPKVEEMARDLTAMGGVTILSIVTLTAFGLTVFSGKRKLAWFGLASVLTGSVITAIIKHGYNRPRPSLVEHGAWVSNPSFPSGHSMMSAVVYLTLGILIARTQPKKRVRIFIVCITMLLTFLVGISRVYLGVHWPTDVAGGWILGGAWALLFWMLARRIDAK
ncbi:phosphatase PAP2 family protein [Luteolibacter algae]|uniref:Phosphatase PAP2 family protein n=1 Tax=Luteolibacter algae TaxID=454151 RepID=A0ABW5D7M5_9BACT